jgi:hypothetical protein
MNFTNPRHQNDLIRIMEETYQPISPDTMKPDKPEYLRPGIPAVDGQWLFDDQVRILNYAFRPDPLPHDTVILSAYKKTGKTGLGGGISYAWSRIYGGEIYFLANAKHHAKDRVFARVQAFFDWMRVHDFDRYKREVTGQWTETIELKNPYSLLQALPCTPGSTAGSFVSLSVWDELWAYDLDSLRRLWTEFSPTPHLAGRSCRLVVTYAGYHGESSLLWSIYEATVNESPTSGLPEGIRIPGLEDLPAFRSEDSGIFAFWAHPGDIYRPWITPEFLEGRANDVSIPKQEYLRLWENRWVAGEDEFIDIGLIDAAGERGKLAGLPPIGRM